VLLHLKLVKGIVSRDWERLQMFLLYRSRVCPIQLKGIVSRDFEVCFLVQLDSSDIATHDRTGSFFLKSISCRILDYLAFAVVVFAVSESWLRERPQLIL
jgi:hypothetical protein